MDEILKKKWIKFVEKNKAKAYEKIDNFLTNLEKEYKQNKLREFKIKGVSYSKAVIKARQSWVVYVGNNLEEIIKIILEPYSF